MQKQKLSDYVAKYKMTEKDIEKHFSTKEATVSSISEYSGLCSTPLLVVYRYLILHKNMVQFKDKLNQLCDFYQIENDIITI
jgi:hypothetical protein